jgi:hypothetical protein
MRQLLFGMAAIGLALALTTNVNAGGPGGKTSHSHSSGTHTSKGSGNNHRDYHRDNHRDYHLTHGSRFKDGSYFYKGKDHNHWSHRYWYGRYGCYTYWCPSTSCWYYWYAPTECYYPVSCLPTYTPTAEYAPVSVPSGVTQIVNVNNNSPGSAVGDGPGAPLPPGR